MKKFIKTYLVFILAIALAFVFAGCSNNNSELESKIIALEDALAESEFSMQEMQDELDSLKSNNKNLTNRVDSTLEDVNDQLDDMQDQIDEFKELTSTDVNVYMADTYYLVVGDTFQLFYRSVIQAPDPYGYYIKVSGDKGHTYNRYFEFTPSTSETGTYSFKIEVCDNNGKVLGSDETKLVVSASTTNTSKKVMVIGDSLTASGQWIARGVSKFTAAGGTITTVGTVKKTIAQATIASTKDVTVNYEGRSGWSWTSYIKQYDSSTYSPFYSTTYGLSIKQYLSTNSLATPTEVYIFMTFNGLTSTDTYDFNCEWLSNAKKLVDQIHKDLPNAKITMFSLPLTSTNAGCGAYYNISLDYSDNYGVHLRIFEYDNFMESWCQMDEYKDFMRYVDVKAQFDSENNMPSENKAVNNTNTKTELVGNAMGMHPSTQGYNQIGDVFYRALMSDWAN